MKIYRDFDLLLLIAIITVTEIMIGIYQTTERIFPVLHMRTQFGRRM